MKQLLFSALFCNLRVGFLVTDWLLQDRISCGRSGMLITICFCLSATATKEWKPEKGWLQKTPKYRRILIQHF